MLDDIPRELWYLFIPKTIEELKATDNNVKSFKKREVEREKVMALQQLYNFPLRPNFAPQEVLAKIMIEKMKRHKKKSQSFDPNRDW